MDQPEVCGCTAGFSTHAVRWSRQPASGLWHVLVVVPCENEVLHGSAKSLADLTITIMCTSHCFVGRATSHVSMIVFAIPLSGDFLVVSHCFVIQGLPYTST